MLGKIAQNMPFPMRETRFFEPPETTYAVYRIDKSYSGCDRHTHICQNDVTIYLVEYSPDPQAVEALEKEMIKRGIEFDKIARTWVESEKFYQTNYSFTYYKKIRMEE